MTGSNDGVAIDSAPAQSGRLRRAPWGLAAAGAGLGAGLASARAIGWMWPRVGFLDATGTVFIWCVLALGAGALCLLFAAPGRRAFGAGLAAAWTYEIARWVAILGDDT